MTRSVMVGGRGSCWGLDNVKSHVSPSKSCERSKCLHTFQWFFKLMRSGSIFFPPSRPLFFMYKTFGRECAGLILVRVWTVIFLETKPGLLTYRLTFLSPSLFRNQTGSARAFIRFTFFYIINNLYHNICFLKLIK